LVGTKIDRKGVIDKAKRDAFGKIEEADYRQFTAGYTYDVLQPQKLSIVIVHCKGAKEDLRL
jgi:hypothetical protein